MTIEEKREFTVLQVINGDKVYDVLYLKDRQISFENERKWVHGIQAGLIRRGFIYTDTNNLLQMTDKGKKHYKDLRKLHKKSPEIQYYKLKKESVL